jgi:hypothetical protein
MDISRRIGKPQWPPAIHLLAGGIDGSTEPGI